ncbi:hypothetical protein OE749_08370 [Aestuariibacter sp. AA17]|uniref:Uncharacterized protein n=1 Tax=Fluctibacter corallii TaxID=2984329 RepID=A0ABT3A7Q1_9ALTE|nr:hypothetical protein [Aestuariibacter sp. AA17]MCV2884708.1 hypothetical protein [Aestuariibacter sp. AA17]
MLYLLGEGYKETDVERSTPYQVLLNSRCGDFPIGLTEGKGMGSIGGSFSPEHVLSDRNKKHLEICNVTWLIPLCEDAVNQSSELDVQAVIDTYAYLHGALPEVIKS